MTTIGKCTTMTWDERLQYLATTRIVPDVFHRVLLAGDYRSGKSTLPRTIWGEDKCEYQTFHRSMPVDDLIGGIDPRCVGQPNSDSTWLDGPATRAMRHGRVLICDEIDAHSADVRCWLHAILDDPAAMTLPTGERVKAAKGYAVVATTNASPASLPHGVYDRFDLILRVNTLSRGLLQSLGSMATAAQAVAGAGIDWEWTRPATVNLFIAAAKLRRHGMADEAIAETLGLEGHAATDFLAAITAPVAE